MDSCMTLMCTKGCSNKSNSTFGVSGDVVANLYFNSPKQEKHKVFADNFLTVYDSLSASNQRVFGILKLFVHHV